MASPRVTAILASALEGSTSADDAPQRLVTACAKALPVTGVGLALMSGDSPAGTVAITDGVAGTMEDLQFTLGEGPCIECSSTGRPILQPDLVRTGPGRWPGFSSGALDAGIRAIFAFPLRVGGISLGVLDLYRDEAGELSDPELTEALSFADAATSMLIHLQDQASRENPGLGSVPVIEDRAEVHQATGMISVQAGVSMAEALVQLRGRAFGSDRPILDVARDVLDGAVSFAETYDDNVDGG